MKENPTRSLPGIPMLLGLLGRPDWSPSTSSSRARQGGERRLLVIAGCCWRWSPSFCLFGFYMVEPNQAAVLSLFGKYIGTVKDNGLRWNNPFFSKKKVSQRVRNFESGKLKVNDLDGSPIEIAAVVVWQVVDSAEAVYNVDDYESFVHIQTESALRAMATSYPYDQHEEGKIALRSHAAEISKHLKEEIEERLSRCRRAASSTRASATSPTRRKSPRRCCSASRPTRSSPRAPASSPARSAWSRWRWPNCRRTAPSQLDEERKAQMVSNLLVVLCSDERGMQPIVNTGSMY